MTKPIKLPSSDASAYPGKQGRLGVEDFAKLFGTDAATIGPHLRTRIESGDFRYVELDREPRDYVAVEVLRQIDSGDLSHAGETGIGRWEKGWGENRDKFFESGFDLSALVPRYIRPLQPIRLNRRYVMPYDANFELNWYDIFRQWLFETRLAPFNAIFEFGCGSGFNLAALAKIFPKKKYAGFDWARPSRDIVDGMAKHFGWDMAGHVFDFFNPDESVTVPSNCAFLTIGALEQTGDRWGAFLDFVMRKRPALVCHVEPIVEWYKDASLEDYAAIRFHQARRYWTGYPDRIVELARTGKAEILVQKRSDFGSLFIEGYSQLIWRPLS